MKTSRLHQFIAVAALFAAFVIALVFSDRAARREAGELLNPVSAPVPGPVAASARALSADAPIAPARPASSGTADAALPTADPAVAETAPKDSALAATLARMQTTGEVLAETYDMNDAATRAAVVRRIEELENG